MSWRRFKVLVRGLSTRSRWWQHLAPTGGGARGARPNVVIDAGKHPDQAHAFFDSLKTVKG